MGRLIVGCLIAAAAPLWGANLLRNGSLELPATVGTTRMLQGQEPYQYHWGNGREMLISWQPTGTEAWWAVGRHPGPERIAWLDDARQAHSGRHCLRLSAGAQPVGVICAAGQVLAAGPATFSLWVRTAGAAGRVRFDTYADGTNLTGLEQEQATARREVALPSTSGWQRLTGTLDVPAGPAAQTMVVRVHVERGTAWIDDVQVESGSSATPFEVRPSERVTVRLVHRRALPVYRLGADEALKAEVVNSGVAPLTGELALYASRWDGAEAWEVTRWRLTDWPAGAVLPASTSLAGRRPDAYRLQAKLVLDRQPVLDGGQCFDGRGPAGGTISKAMVQAPCVARFALAGPEAPGELFGSGDMMLNTGGSWWGGYPVADYLEGRQLGFRFSRERVDDDASYRLAAGGMRAVGDGPRPWTAPPDLPAELRNPVKRDAADLSNPAVWPAIEQMWERLGDELSDNPLYPLLHVTGEEMVLYGGALCPSDAADADFRAWVKARHGTLEGVSRAWGRPVRSWGEVEQIISARMVRERLVKVERDQAKRLDWLGAADQLNAEQKQLLQADPGRGLDWLHWRTDVYLRALERVSRAFRRRNRTTLLGNHFCWPDFVPQTTYGLARRLDALGIDTQYPCGLPGSLGTPAETIDMLGMYDTLAEGRPVWGHEVYIQPKFAAEMPALQVWGMVAHGLTVVNNFAWKPYSDHGLQAKRWNEPGAPPWWFVIDFDGRHMPQFDPLVRATREVNAFGDRYQGARLRRAPAEAAMLVSADSGVYSHFETAGQWWNSPVQHARCELGWLLRLNGVSLDYLDDEHLASRLSSRRYAAVFVPYSPCLSEATLARLATYARRGGTLVMAGPSGRLDPWGKERANVGGEAFADLAWSAPGYQATTPAGTDRLCGQGPASFRGGEPLRGPSGEAIGWVRPFGRGKVIALQQYPAAYTQSPHTRADHLKLAASLIELSGVKPLAQWLGGATPTPGKLAGEGAPVVDVMVRDRSATERFVFIMNLGGAGAGEVRLRLGDEWQFTDAVSGATVAAHQGSDGYRLKLDLPPWGYRVIRAYLDIEAIKDARTRSRTVEPALGR